MERFPGVCGLHVTTGSLEVEEKGGARVRVETSKMDCGCVWGGGGRSMSQGTQVPLEAGKAGTWTLPGPLEEHSPAHTWSAQQGPREPQSPEP